MRLAPAGVACAAANSKGAIKFLTAVTLGNDVIADNQGEIVAGIPSTVPVIVQLNIKE